MSENTSPEPAQLDDGDLGGLCVDCKWRSAMADPGGFLRSLTFTGEAIDPADLPPPVSDDNPVMVVTALRVPFDEFDRIRRVAAAQGLDPKVLIGQWVEQGLAAAENDEPISRADAMRALAGLRPARDADQRRLA